MLAVEQNKVLIPPSYNKYLAWGYSDLSVRIGNYESEKVIYHLYPLFVLIHSYKQIVTIRMGSSIIFFKGFHYIF